jgi:hypothetical protein
MTGALIEYCKTQKDPYGEVPHIKAALAVAMKK